MIRITLKSGIVVEGELSPNQVPTKRPSITLIANHRKVAKIYKDSKSYTTGEKQSNNCDVVEYRSHEFNTKELKKTTIAVIMEETIANREVLELL